MTISVAIVAMDEEANIGRTLASVAWADEIVLVDSGSKDRTCEIAREHGARVIAEPWRGYVAQKQYAIELCTKDWVLLLDADEEISAGLAEEIRSSTADPRAANGYKLPRKNLFLGRWMRHGGFYPDPKLRLFRRGQGFVTGHDPHDRCELKPEFPQQTRQFKNAMVHYTYPNLTLYIAHMNRYSSLGAKLALAKGHRRFSFADIVLRPLATFIYNYFIRLGFLDGREGLLLHLYHAVYVSWKYSKAWEMSRSTDVGAKADETS
ncbi:MAG TPA: glycosyltransferase family 2 protein [Candidatus Sulfotelmatobacter sp.]|nr:glycosyltransferase family 2 protein [Candidatus Sulfotelmatobacter sp.]